MFIYETTLSELCLFMVFLEKVVQLGTSTRSLSFLLTELDMDYITDHGGS